MKVQVTKVWIEPAIGLRGEDSLRIDLSDDFHIAVPLSRNPLGLADALFQAVALIGGHMRDSSQEVPHEQKRETAR